MEQQPEIDSELIELFTQRLTAVGGHVHRVPNSIEAAATIANIVTELAAHDIWVSPAVEYRAPEAISALQASELTLRRAQSPIDVRDQPVGLVVADGAIAETGSAVMSERNLEARSVSLMTKALVTLCATETVVPSLDEAGPILRAIGADHGSYATFITGPSRSADIERQLTVGVQGPGIYHFVLVDRLA